MPRGMEAFNFVSDVTMEIVLSSSETSGNGTCSDRKQSDLG